MYRICESSSNFMQGMNIRNKIEAVMQSDSTTQAGWLASGLSAMAVLYDTGMGLRTTAYARGWIKKKRLDCFVISVGNITVGGTGKTPVTLYLARRIQSYGYRVVVINRGYKGSAEASGGVAGNGEEVVMPASACGDEAYMMAGILKGIPVVVGQDRYAVGTMALQKFQPQVILLDDGFQHIRLERDIDLVLLDAVRPFGNGKLVPRGILRERKDAMQRASAVILTRAGQGSIAAFKKVELHVPGKPIFQCAHKPYIAGTILANAAGRLDSPANEAASGLDSLERRHGYVFSGIAHNEQFQETLESAGLHVCGTSFFDDHHWYSEEELKEIMQSAGKCSAELLITTQKDFARIPRDMSWPLDLVVMGVEIQFADEAFDQYIQQELMRKIK
jgi:tetraacyldisaccharide 4'-kinase